MCAGAFQRTSSRPLRVDTAQMTASLVGNTLKSGTFQNTSPWRIDGRVDTRGLDIAVLGCPRESISLSRNPTHRHHLGRRLVPRRHHHLSHGTHSPRLVRIHHRSAATNTPCGSAAHCRGRGTSYLQPPSYPPRRCSHFSHGS